MSAWTNGTYTRKGVTLLAKLTQGSSLRITRAVAGTGYVRPETLADQTTIIGVKQELAFMAASYPEAGTCKLPVFLTNSGLAAGYKARQIGLYANDPDEGEILYFVAQSETGTDVPGAEEMPDYSATWTFYFHYGQADDVTVNVDPSHTVTPDMLAEVREIAEAGVSNAKGGVIVRNDNAAALPFAGLKLFGKTTQDGTPTPDHPQELVNVENPTITICGKNILKPSGTKTQNGVTLTLNEDGTYTLSGTATGYANINIGNAYVVAGRKYKPTVVVYSGSVKPAFWNFEKESNMDTDGNGYLSSSVDTMMSAFIFNDKEGVTLNAHFAIMLELVTDSETGVYEPYKEEQTLTVNTPNGLPGIPVSSGGNYTDENGQQWICDEIDFQNGVYRKRVFEKVWDSTCPYQEAGTQVDGTYTVFTFDDEISMDENYKYMSDLFPCYSSNSYKASAAEGIYTNPGTTNCNLIILRLSNERANDLNSFANWLASHPITVLCALKTPVETALTAAELTAYAALVANNPVTTVVNDAGAWMEVDLVEAQHEKAFQMVKAQLEDKSRFAFTSGSDAVDSFSFTLPGNGTYLFSVAEELNSDEDAAFVSFGVVALIENPQFAAYPLSCITINKSEYTDLTVDVVNDTVTLDFSAKRYVTVHLLKIG